MRLDLTWPMVPMCRVAWLDVALPCFALWIYTDQSGFHSMSQAEKELRLKALQQGQRNAENDLDLKSPNG